MKSAMRTRLALLMTRATESRFAKPIARVVLLAAGLILLAFIGRSAIAGGWNAGPPSASEQAIAMADTGIPDSAATAVGPPSSTPALPSSLAQPSASAVEPAHPSSRGAASPDDPVILNLATTADLRRLPGIGEKRADSILSLRARLGRFRAVEDLLKVKGIGRAMLRRLRPLVRLDPVAPRDAGASPP